MLQHLEENGTLKMRVKDNGVGSFKEIVIVAIDLSEYEGFSDTFSRKRTALEFLVQTHLSAKGCSAKNPFEIISNVTANKLVNDFMLQEFA